MTVFRVYLPQQLQINATLSVPQDIAHHLQHVLRLSCDDELIVFNGQDGEFKAKIVAINKKEVLVEILKWQPGIAESPLITHLGQGIARGEKMDTIIQKSVELGVNFITPLFTEFCNVQLSNDRFLARLKHWQKIAIHASEQCGRCYVPEVMGSSPDKGQRIEDFLRCSLSELDSIKIILIPEADASFNTLPIASAKKVVLLVGPEGGFSADEIKAAIDHGFYACRIGPRILRTETAALVALSILQEKFGDLIK